MSIRKELGIEELNQIIGGTAYNAYYFELSGNYIIYSATGDIVATCATQEDYDTFVAKHSGDTFNVTTYTE